MITEQLYLSTGQFSECLFFPECLTLPVPNKPFFMYNMKNPVGV